MEERRDPPPRPGDLRRRRLDRDHGGRAHRRGGRAGRAARGRLPLPAHTPPALRAGGRRGALERHRVRAGGGGPEPGEPAAAVRGRAAAGRGVGVSVEWRVYNPEALVFLDAGLSPRIARALRMHYTTPAQVRRASDEELLGIRTLGTGALAEIRAVLGHYPVAHPSAAAWPSGVLGWEASS